MFLVRLGRLRAEQLLPGDDPARGGVRQRHRYQRRHRRGPGRIYWGSDAEAGGIPAAWLEALQGWEVVEAILRGHA